MGERENGRARGRHLSPRVSSSRAPVFSCAHYFQAPATQAKAALIMQMLCHHGIGLMSRSLNERGHVTLIAIFSHQFNVVPRAFPIFSREKPWGRGWHQLNFKNNGSVLLFKTPVDNITLIKKHSILFLFVYKVGLTPRERSKRGKGKEKRELCPEAVTPVANPIACKSLKF